MNDQQTIKVASLFDGDKISYRKIIRIKNGCIDSIDSLAENEECLFGMLVPGFIDIQVNGGGGFLFNQSPDVETLIGIASAHQKFGTTGWLPTLVTDNIEKMQQAADAVSDARRVKNTGILGIHFEGPHLSIAKKGVHSAELIRGLGEREKQLFMRQDLGKVVVTLAPENVSPELIAELVNAGVLVCLGHSNADFETAQRALDAGASGFTHLFNAMSQFTSREPGMVGAALLDKKSYAGIILDGIHVHPDSAKLAFSQKKNIMLVTDAMPPVGCKQTSFEFFGQQVQREGNKLTDRNGSLAGSVLDMNTAVNNLAKILDIEKTEAINYASKMPAQFLGLQKKYGKIKVHFKASMLLFDDKGSIVSSWINGDRIFG